MASRIVGLPRILIVVERRRSGSLCCWLVVRRTARKTCLEEKEDLQFCNLLGRALLCVCTEAHVLSKGIGVGRVLFLLLQPHMHATALNVLDAGNRLDMKNMITNESKPEGQRHPRVESWS
jgi:hypothetical protein